MTGDKFLKSRDFRNLIFRARKLSQTDTRVRMTYFLQLSAFVIQNTEPIELILYVMTGDKFLKSRDFRNLIRARKLNRMRFMTGGKLERGKS